MRDLVRGMGHLLNGQRWVAGHGRWWGFGMIPALITLVGYAAVLILLALYAGDLTAWATPFADDWSAPWQGLFRGLFTATVFGGGLLLALISFTAVTLLVGQPFYESLAARVDETEGGAPAARQVPLLRELAVSARDSVRVLLRVAGFAIILFALGFVPVIGQTVVPAIGFCVSGFFLTLELAAVALQRRDVALRERLRLLRGRMTLVLGFGVPLVLLFLVPLVAVLAMPGAVAGATLLVRDLLPPTADDAAAADQTADGTADDAADDAGATDGAAAERSAGGGAP